jgi:hypothetical protein
VPLEALSSGWRVDTPVGALLGAMLVAGWVQREYSMRLPLLAVWDVEGGLAVRRSWRSRSDTLVEVLLLAGIFSGVK